VRVKITQKVTPPLCPLPQGEGMYKDAAFSKSGFGTKKWNGIYGTGNANILR